MLVWLFNGLIPVVNVVDTRRQHFGSFEFWSYHPWVRIHPKLYTIMSNHHPIYITKHLLCAYQLILAHLDIISCIHHVLCGTRCLGPCSKTNWKFCEISIHQHSRTLEPRCKRCYSLSCKLLHHNHPSYHTHINGDNEWCDLPALQHVTVK